MKSLIVSATAAMLCTLVLSGTALASSKTFVNPKVGADRLDLCLNWGTRCGKPAADAYCKKKGYALSTGHVVAHDIGASTPTRLITTGAVCDQAYCDGFEQITCAKPDYVSPPPPKKVFAAPKLGSERLDLCIDWGQGCGKPAAQKFCQTKGYAKALSFSIAHDIGAATPTRLIGTGAVCDQGFCDGFKAIVCSK